MDTRVHPVILSSGSPLWHSSCRQQSKPFLPLPGGRSLLKRSLDRVDDRLRFAWPTVVVGGDEILVTARGMTQLVGKLSGASVQ